MSGDFRPGHVTIAIFVAGDSTRSGWTSGTRPVNWLYIFCTSAILDRSGVCNKVDSNLAGQLGRSGARLAVCFPSTENSRPGFFPLIVIQIHGDHLHSRLTNVSWTAGNASSTTSSPRFNTDRRRKITGSDISTILGLRSWLWRLLRLNLRRLFRGLNKLRSRLSLRFLWADRPEAAPPSPG
jgi:hypothetical protein